MVVNKITPRAHLLADEHEACGAPMRLTIAALRQTWKSHTE